MSLVFSGSHSQAAPTRSGSTHNMLPQFSSKEQVKKGRWWCQHLFILLFSGNSIHPRGGKPAFYSAHHLKRFSIFLPPHRQTPLSLVLFRWGESLPLCPDEAFPLHIENSKVNLVGGSTQKREMKAAKLKLQEGVGRRQLTALGKVCKIYRDIGCSTPPFSSVSYDLILEGSLFGALAFWILF